VSQWNANGPRDIGERGCRGEADLQPLLTGGQAKPQADMGLAGAAWPERDDVLTAIDELAAGEFHRQRLVERRDGLEVEAVEALGGRELCRLDAALDHPALALDQLELAEPQQVADMIFVLGRTLLGQLGVFGLEGR